MVQKLALAITIIGALNWGVVGLFSFDVVAQLANGHAQSFARFFYMIVGISGLLSLGMLFDKEREKQMEHVTVGAGRSVKKHLPFTRRCFLM